MLNLPRVHFNKLLSDAFCYMCHPASGHGVTRFVAPQCNLVRAGWGVRGFEGARGQGVARPLKTHGAAQRTNVRVTEERIVIEQAIIFIVSAERSLFPVFEMKSRAFPPP